MKRILIFLLLFVACSRDSVDPPPPPPEKAILVFPVHNSACTAGVVLTDSTSSVTFTWNASANTDSYEITVRNLLTRVTTSKVITTNSVLDTLLRNTPYSWTIKSMSDVSPTVIQSDTSKFYMSGPAASFYSPFPAALTAPVFGQSISGSTINLTWSGEDIDNDIVGYDVYLGAATSPPLYQGNISNMFLNNVPVTAGIYYWKVVTHDSQGNTATSDIYNFQVN